MGSQLTITEGQLSEKAAKRGFAYSDMGSCYGSSSFTGLWQGGFTLSFSLDLEGKSEEDIDRILDEHLAFYSRRLEESQAPKETNFFRKVLALLTK